MSLFKQNTNDFVLLKDVQESIKRQYSMDNIDDRKSVKEKYKLHSYLTVDDVNFTLQEKIRNHDVVDNVLLNGYIKILFIGNEGIGIVDEINCPISINVPRGKAILMEEASAIKIDVCKSIKEVVDRMVYDTDYYKNNAQLLDDIFEYPSDK